MDNFLIPVLDEVPGQLRAVKVYKNHRDAVARNFIVSFRKKKFQFLDSQILTRIPKARSGAISIFKS